MGQVFHTRRIVEFADTDMAGIVHFSKFFCYMEAAEHEFLRSLGLSVMLPLEGRIITWPRVSCSFDYKQPIRFEQEIDIFLQIERLGEKSMSYSVKIEHAEETAAIGKSTIVCCQYEEGKSMVSTEIPPLLREKLQPFLAE